MVNLTSVYSLTVFGLTLAASIILFFVTRRIEKKRLAQIEKRKNFESVKTDTPLDEPRKASVSRGLKSIGQRFARIRRIVIPIAITFILAGATLPFLDKIPAAYMSFFLGTFTVIAGIAARPFIENVIAGMVITLGKPIRIGDTVMIDDHYGTVEEITLTYSIVKIWDWRRYIIPNKKMIEKEIINHSLIDTYCWAYVEFCVAPQSNLQLVKSKAIEAMTTADGFADYEPPTFWVMDLNKDSIRCWVAGWANTPSTAWNLRSETRIKLANLLQEHGIQFQRIDISTDPTQFSLPQGDPRFPGNLKATS